MIIEIITSAMTALFIGAVMCAVFGIYRGFNINAAEAEETDSGEPSKLLTVGCSVKYHGRDWEIRRFLVDSENQTIAEIESRDNGEHIIRRTMVPVEELEEVE